MPRNEKKKPPQIWPAFEAPPGLVRAAADWKRLFGSHYESAKELLRLKSGLASAVPCPAKKGCGCDHAVVNHGNNDLVSVCRCSPKRCPTNNLEKEDALILEVSSSKFGSAIAQTLGIKAEGREVDGLKTTWQIGTYFPRATIGIPFFLTVQIGPHEMRAVAEGLVARTDKPFILISPTSSNWKPEYEEVLKRKKARFLPLADIVTWNGKLSATQSIDKLLAELVEEGLPAPESEQALRDEGGIWRVTYDGVTISITDSKGMTYIAHLLRNPGQEIPAFNLQAVSTGTPLPSPFGARELRDGGDGEQYGARTSGRKKVAAGSLLDQAALDQYRQRISDLEEELREAEINNDTGRAASLRQEFNTLTQEVARATGLGGRMRRGDDIEKARQAVSSAIHRVLDPLKKSHPALWQHLTNSLNIGAVLSYKPEKATVWAP